MYEIPFLIGQLICDHLLLGDAGMTFLGSYLHLRNVASPIVLKDMS